MFPNQITEFVKGKSLEEISYNDSCSGDKIFKLDDEYFLKVSKNISNLRKEAMMNIFLGNFLNVSKSILFIEDNNMGYYIKTKQVGKSVLELDEINGIEAIKNLCKALKLFHSIDSSNCPYVIDKGYKTIIHGDYCLPNILFDGDKIGFIDTGSAGVGDPWRDYAWFLERTL